MTKEMEKLRSLLDQHSILWPEANIVVLLFKDKNNMQAVTDALMSEGYTVQCCKRKRNWEVGILAKSWKDE